MLSARHMTCSSSRLALGLGSYSPPSPIYVPNTCECAGGQQALRGETRSGWHPLCRIQGQSPTSKWCEGVIDNAPRLLMVGGRAAAEKSAALMHFFQVSVYLPSVDPLSCLHIWMWTLKYCWPVPESQEYPAVLLIFPYDWISWIIMLLCVCTYVHTWIFWHISQKC